MTYYPGVDPVADAAAYYAAQYSDPLWQYYNTFQLVDGVRSYLLPFPTNAYAPNTTVANTPLSNTPSRPPPQYQFTFDTIGQVIFRSIGNCRLPLRTIWAQGINESGDVSISNTMTFAAALCAPIDPDEEGFGATLWAGGSIIYDSGGVVIPPGWTPADAALLATSLANLVIYPGNETQLPADLIVADKGADKTNAFRGIRYIIFPDYPIGGGSSGGGGTGAGIPQLSVEFQRTNAPADDDGAVEFLPGAT